MSQVIGFPGYELLLPNIARAGNASLYDEDGTRYVDLESGVWCTSVGHCNKAVLDAICEQSGKLGHVGYSYLTPIVERAAERVLKLTGFEGGKCVLLCSGSEAIEYGMRVARMVAPKPTFLTMNDAYYGAYGDAHSRTGDAWFGLDWHGCLKCPHNEPCGEGCEYFAGIPFERIGGFLFEPGSSGGVVRFPPQKLINAIAARIKASDGLLIMNEVTTGIGRTGKWFGYEHYGLKPDIVAMGKGVGNGYPVSVAALSPGVIKRLGDTPVRYAQSHQNDAAGAAAVLAVLDYIESNNLLERCAGLSGLLSSGLEALRAKHPFIKDIRGRGLMFAVEFDSGVDPTLSERLHRMLVERGYILTHRPGHNVLRLDPCLTIEREDIDGFLDVFGELLAAV